MPAARLTGLGEVRPLREHSGFKRERILVRALVAPTRAVTLHPGTIRWPGVPNYQANGKLLPGVDSPFVYHPSQNMND